MGLADALGVVGGPREGAGGEGRGLVSSEGRARVGLWILLLLTLFSFAQVFAEGDYPGPALLGMVLAAGIAIAARRLGLWTGTTACVSAVVLFLYLVVIFQARNSFYLLPTPDAVAGLARSIGNALRHSSVDFAPVPVRTGYVILVVVGMWAATTIGEIATFRWRRPLLAVLPCIGLFCIQMTVGTGTGGPVLAIAFLVAVLTYWGFEAAHRVRSWGRWVPAWPDPTREGREPESVTGALARRMGAGCVAAAVIAPMIVPALGDGLLAWRNDVGDGGFGSGGGSGEINPLVSIAPRLLQQSDEVLFTVEADRREYWRLVSLARFDGEEWQPFEGGEVEDVAGGESFLGQSNGPVEAERLEQTITFEDLESAQLPAAVNPFELDVPDGLGVAYNEESQDLVLSEEADEGFSYTVASNVPRITFQELRQGVVDRTLPDVYLDTPGVSGRVKGMARGLRVDEDGEELSDGDFLIALQDHLRSSPFTYEDSPDFVEAVAEGGGSVDYLDQFLFESRAGYCQQFATAFAVLARTQGIPTRVTVGFLPGELDPDDGTFRVTGLHTHAWPEVYFEGYGWVRFDPTPRLEAPEPRYTREPLGPGGFAGGGGAGGTGAAVARQEVTDRRLAGANTGAAGSFDLPLGNFDADRPVAANPAWERAFDRIVVAVAVALMVFLASVPALKTWRIRRRYRRARGADGAAAAAFAHFEDEAAELAAPRGAAESAAAFARRLGRLRQVPPDDAARLAQIYEAAEYAPRGVRTDQARQAKVLARKLRAAMWARASWWTRAGRLFSPRRLVGRP